jgi:hypothetical protein
MHWHRLDKEKAIGMITRIQSDNDPMLFSANSSEAKCARLPFYSNHLLFRLTNFSCMPTFSMDFLGNGEQFIYLDGTDDPIMQINNMAGLHLNKDNVIPYLNFYFFNVRPDGEDILILKNPDEGQYLDLYDEERREDMHLVPENSYVFYDDQTGNFKVTAPLYYLGGVVQADILVTRDGKVTVNPTGMLVSERVQ